MVSHGFKKLWWVRLDEDHLTLILVFFGRNFGFEKCRGASSWFNIDQDGDGCRIISFLVARYGWERSFLFFVAKNKFGTDFVMSIFRIFVQFIGHPLTEFLVLLLCSKWLTTVDLLTTSSFTNSKTVVREFDSTKPFNTLPLTSEWCYWLSLFPRLKISHRYFSNHRYTEHWFICLWLMFRCCFAKYARHFDWDCIHRCIFVENHLSISVIEKHEIKKCHCFRNLIIQKEW